MGKGEEGRTPLESTNRKKKNSVSFCDLKTSQVLVQASGCLAGDRREGSSTDPAGNRALIPDLRERRVTILEKSKQVHSRGGLQKGGHPACPLMKANHLKLPVQTQGVWPERNQSLKL